MILIQQNSEVLGSFLPSDIKKMLLFRRVRSADSFSWPGSNVWLSYQDFKSFLDLLTDSDVIMYGDKDLILTRDRILLQTQVYKKEEIDEFTVMIPERFKDLKAVFVRNIAWWVAVVFFWTLVIPVAIWYMNQKSPKEEGLGEVYGIRLTGSLGREIIKDGMGLLAADSPKRAELAETCQILRDWKAGKLPEPLPTLEIQSINPLLAANKTVTGHRAQSLTESAFGTKAPKVPSKVT